MNHDSLTDRHRIKALFDIGITKATTIFNKLQYLIKLKYRSVASIVSNLKNGKTLNRKPYYREKLINTTKNQKKLQAIMGKKEYIRNAITMKKYLKLDCHVQTIRKIAHSAGYEFSKTIQAPLLKEDHIKARIKFAKFHLNNKTNWRNAIFLDESSVWSFCFPRKVWTKEKIKKEFPSPKYP